jgi:succinate dehydrogenase/fumarate reductase cytochrome b subunit
MPLWFEIVVLILLFFLVHSVDGIRHDIRDLTAATRERDKQGNSPTTLSND